MKRHLFDLLALFAAASLFMGYLAAAQPGLRNVALHVYVLAVGGLLMLGLIAATGDAASTRATSPFDRALAQKAPGESPIREVERMQREVTLATASAFDLHTRLLPHLREIAQARLEQAGHEAGPETLGRWWELLRPDRPMPADRSAPGISRADLRALVAHLARM